VLRAPNLTGEALQVVGIHRVPSDPASTAGTASGVMHPIDDIGQVPFVGLSLLKKWHRHEHRYPSGAELPDLYPASPSRDDLSKLEAGPDWVQGCPTTISCQACQGAGLNRRAALARSSRYQRSR
jgi:hypothetical protein